MKHVVFGGTGFLGELLVEMLVKKGDDVLVIARNEGKLINLQQKFPSIKIITGDIAESFTIARAFHFKPDGIFLLSAFKHVGMAEDQVNQCVRSNVVGVMKVLRASLIKKPKFIILTSTDKAAQVSGVYGCTKLLGERLFQEAQKLNPETKYRVVRYGNVLYSTGSVLCKWKEKIERGEEVIITDGEATRFFWTREEAIDLIVQCLKEATDATPFVPEMKSIRIWDLLMAMCEKYGEGKEIPVKTIGLQAGENMHEKINDNGPYSNEVKRYSQSEIMERI